MALKHTARTVNCSHATTRALRTALKAAFPAKNIPALLLHATLANAKNNGKPESQIASQSGDRLKLFSKAGFGATVALVPFILTVESALSMPARCALLAAELAAVGTSVVSSAFIGRSVSSYAVNMCINDDFTETVTSTNHSSYMHRQFQNPSPGASQKGTLKFDCAFTNSNKPRSFSSAATCKIEPLQIPHIPSLRLYRQAIRASRVFPAPHLRARIVRNARDLVRLYANVRDPEEVDRLIRGGQEDVRMLKAWLHLEPETVNKIFRNPEPLKSR